MSKILRNKNYDLFLVDILLKATGNAPIMKKRKWAVEAEKKIGSVIEFIKKYLRLDPSENLVSFSIFFFSVKML